MNTQTTTGYKSVNGLNLYYEIHGEGAPLVLLHGGGSTIGTTFGKSLHLFAKNRQVIAIELQAHGHTPDIDRPLTFEQDADDVANLLQQLQITQADFFGFSNGGSTVLQIGIRHPGIVRRLISASSCYKRDAFYPWLWELLSNASLDNMPKPLQDAYLEINPGNQAGLVAMHDRDRDRMLIFEDWPDDAIRSIKAPTLLINADQDVVMPEHTLAMYRLLPQGRLVILPGTHGEYIGEITTNPPKGLIEATVAIIDDFLG
jgi:pimeloyl-ACP methyl ester carboxylesterase